MIPDLDLYLPDQALDQTLAPCPKCGAEYNIPRTRRGPALFVFTKNAYRVICEAEGCCYKGKMERTADKAIHSWNNQVELCKLKQLRSQAGLSQMALAERAGIGWTAISKIENGHQVPTEYMRTRLAAALCVDPSEL